MAAKKLQLQTTLEAFFSKNAQFTREIVEPNAQPTGLDQTVHVFKKLEVKDGWVIVHYEIPHRTSKIPSDQQHGAQRHRVGASSKKMSFEGRTYLSVEDESYSHVYISIAPPKSL